MGDSYISLLAIVGVIFPFNFFGCRTPQLEFSGMSGHSGHAQWLMFIGWESGDVNVVFEQVYYVRRD